MSTGNQRRPGRRELRRERKLAKERQQAWAEIRARQGLDEHIGHAGYEAHVDGPAGVPATAAPSVGGHHRRPPLIGSAAPRAVDPPGPPAATGTRPRAATSTGRRAAILAAVHPVAIAIAGVLAFIAGTPVVDGDWHLVWFAGAGVTTLVLTGLYPRVWRGARPVPRTSGILVGLLIAASSVAGVLGQNVVEGRAQLRGSDIDRAVDEHRELTRSVAIIAENQRLLSLPPEQAIPLGDTYARARLQAIAIGELWNPATRGNPPLPEFRDAYIMVNLAAAQQAAALDAFVANLENPEPAIAAEVAERGLAVDVLLADDIPGKLTDIDRAIRDTVSGKARP